MRIQILSDIHLEFKIREYNFPDCDVLIVPGDIHEGTKGVKWLSEKTKGIPVIYILGNHEYYQHSYPQLIQKMKKASEGSNIHILENESIEIDNISFHGMTLWTDFELFGDPRAGSLECQTRMYDYTLIRHDPTCSKLRPVDTRVIHKESLRWLNKSLSNSSTSKNIVISHHAPSIQSIALEYRNDLVSTGFASHLEKIIEKHGPDIWIHGHTHQAFDYTIGTTRIICNPHGYPGENTGGFNDRLIVEIKA